MSTVATISESVLFRPLARSGGVRPLGGCRHCGASEIRRRDLCRACYEQPAIRAQYPRLFRSLEAGNTEQARPLPEPTDELPGTPGKTAVVCQRARDGQQLWHPADAKLDRRRLEEMEAARAWGEFIADVEEAARG